MNNDNDLNLHSMTKLSGWLRYTEVKLKAINHHAVYHPVEMVDSDVSLVLLIKTIIL